jgi:hypothetical protein
MGNTKLRHQIQNMKNNKVLNANNNNLVFTQQTKKIKENFKKKIPLHYYSQETNKTAQPELIKFFS